VGFPRFAAEGLCDAQFEHPLHGGCNAETRVSVPRFTYRFDQCSRERPKSGFHRMFRGLCMSYALAMSKVTIFSLCILVLLASRASAQEKIPGPAGNGITAAMILEKNVTATGGLEAFQRLQSMVMRGEIGLSNPRSSASISFFYQAPKSNALQLRINGIGTFWAGDHEDNPISRGAPEHVDLMRLDNTEMEPLNIRAILIDLNNLLKRQVSDKIKVELLGRAEVDGRCALGLSFTPPRGYRVLRYYDCETFLLVRMDQVERLRRFKDGPETEQVVRSYFTDYKESFGVKLPRVIRISRPQGESELKLSEIEANVKIDRSIFE